MNKKNMKSFKGAQFIEKYNRAFNIFLINFLHCALDFADFTKY